MKQQITDYDVIVTMKGYGGSFVSSLAEACFRANEQNLAKLKLAFPELWQEYRSIAMKLREKKNETT